MRIQDIYTIGTRMHSKLLAKNIHTIGMKHKEFKRIWEEVRNEIQDELDAGKVDLVNKNCMGEIDFNLVLD